MANKKPTSAKSASSKSAPKKKTVAKAKAAAPSSVPDPKSYSPELSRAIEHFGHMAGYYVQCTPGDQDEKTQQVASMVSGLQRMMLASSGSCPSGWMHCPDGSCVPPGTICP